MPAMVFRISSFVISRPMAIPMGAPRAMAFSGVTSLMFTPSGWARWMLMKHLEP